MKSLKDKFSNLQLKNSNSDNIQTNNIKILNLWSKNFDGTFQSGNLPISSAGALVGKHFVFAADQNGRFYCFNKLDGRVVWSKQSKGDMLTTASVDSKSIFYGTSYGRFYSRSKNTGKLNYKVDLGAGIVTSPVFYKGRVFIHLNNHKIIALDQTTGKILWAYTRSVPFITTIQGAAKPFIYHGKLFIGFSDGYLTSFRLEDGVLLWEKKIGLNNKFIDLDFRPFLFERNLYVFAEDEELNVVNPKNGKILKKFEIYPLSLSLSTIDSSKNVKNKKQLIVGTKKGHLVVIKGSIVLKNIKISQSGINKIIPWRSGYFASDLAGKIYYLNSDLNIIWKKYLGHSYSTILGEVNVNQGVLAIYTSRQKLYIYQLN